MCREGGASGARNSGDSTMSREYVRRRVLAGAGACLLLAPVGAAEKEEKKGSNAGEEKEVGAVEDLMREHGVLRRALLVYIETVPRIHQGAADLDAGALT